MFHIVIPFIVCLCKKRNRGTAVKKIFGTSLLMLFEGLYMFNFKSVELRNILYSVCV